MRSDRVRGYQWTNDANGLWLGALPIVIAMASLLAAIIVVSNTHDVPGSRLLFALPSTYALLLLALPAMWKYKSGHIGLSILNLVLFVRYVVLPFLGSFTVGDAPERGVAPTVQGMNDGLWIMSVELISAFLVVQIFAPKMYQEKDRSNYPPLRFGVVFVGVVLAGIVCLFAFPQVRTRYNFFLSSGEIDKSGLGVPFAGAVVTVTDLAILVVPLLAISWLHTKYQRNPSIYYVLWSLIAVFPVVTIFKGTSRFSVVFPTVAFLIILIKLYPKHRGMLTSIVVPAGVAVFAVITTRLQEMTQANGRLTVSRVVQTLDSYLSGPNNMARVVDLKRLQGSHFTVDTLKNDLLNNIALLSSFADSSNTTTAWFNYHFYNHRAYADQIVPLSGQSYIYFGILGAPLLLILTLILMMGLDGQVGNETRIEYVYVKVILIGYMSMAMMVSFGSIYPLFTNLYLPLILVFSLNRGVRLQNS